MSDIIADAVAIMLSGSGGGTTNTDFDKLVQEAESNCLLEFDIVEGVYTARIVFCDYIPAQGLPVIAHNYITNADGNTYKIYVSSQTYYKQHYAIVYKDSTALWAMPSSISYNTYFSQNSYNSGSDGSGTVTSDDPEFYTPYLSSKQNDSVECSCTSVTLPTTLFNTSRIYATLSYSRTTQHTCYYRSGEIKSESVAESTSSSAMMLSPLDVGTAIINGPQIYTNLSRTDLENAALNFQLSCAEANGVDISTWEIYDIG